MSEMPQYPQNRPLVTFALFAYNQEKYIREAVEGAFSQTYEPLEIILSDDCSSDRTFEIMQEMATEYKGSHAVKLNRNSINLGTAAHVSSVFSLSGGKLFVVAAGDDISYPNRVEKIYSTWMLNGQRVSLVHSAMVQFDHEGQESYRTPIRNGATKQVVTLDRFVEDWRMPSLAPTCAYSREIFSYFSPLSGGSLIEDLPLLVRSLAISKIIYIDEPLVRARKLQESAGQGYTVHQTKRWNRFVHSRMTALNDIIRDTEKMDGYCDDRTLSGLRRKSIKKISSHAKLILDLTDYPSFVVRLMMFLKLSFGRSLSGRLLERIKYALIFAFPELHQKFKQWRNLP